MLEFATLSRLTGDGRFEKAAYKVTQIVDPSPYEALIACLLPGFFRVME
jgi:hypothetical protein